MRFTLSASDGAVLAESVSVAAFLDALRGTTAPEEYRYSRYSPDAWSRWAQFVTAGSSADDR